MDMGGGMVIVRSERGRCVGGECVMGVWSLRRQKLLGEAGGDGWLHKPVDVLDATERYT